MIDLNTTEPLDPKKYSFWELLAFNANAGKNNIIMGILSAAGKGDKNALEMVKQALDEVTPQEEKNKPIPILGGITQKTNGVSSDDRGPQNTSATKTA